MGTKYLLPEGTEKYKEFIRHQFANLAVMRFPCPPIYHYTTGTNLIEIIRSGELWTTQIACLNDVKELLHAVDVLVDAISEREKQPLRDDFAALLGKMRELLTEPDPEAAGVFVACFSERNDDLSQWRAYGGPDGGYAIEFDIETLLTLVAKRGGYLIPVTYDENAKDILMTEILSSSEIYFDEGIANERAPSTEEWVNEFAVYWLSQLAFLAPMIKHPSFKDEKEWRLIYYLREEDVSKMRFTERSSMMRRHLPLTFSTPDKNGNTPLPIKGITVGAKAYQKLTSFAVGDLLKSKGYAADQVPVTLSDIPFRIAR